MKNAENAPTLAIVAVDTAENGPSKVRQVTNKVCRNIGVQAFQARLRELDVDFGYDPEAEQVTVAKMRTIFQTQVRKTGETDVSHELGCG